MFRYAATLFYAYSAVVLGPGATLEQAQGRSSVRLYPDDMSVYCESV